MSFDEIRTAIETIRTETQRRANTAERVGDCLHKITNGIVKARGQIVLLSNQWSYNSQEVVLPDEILYPYYPYDLPVYQMPDPAVIVAPDCAVYDNYRAYIACGIKAVENSINGIVFSCDIQPAVELYVNFIMF